ncbi:uncharacterized protein BJX67DRAFT_229196 [Aspergillus lucknowensis]|uniref:Uncharacterized protein n=1 Tax=Aspergillus lucknowensis TaxID=176173 RepID=A0ABR4LHE7_9EURO
MTLHAEGLIRNWWDSTKIEVAACHMGACGKVWKRVPIHNSPDNSATAGESLASPALDPTGTGNCIPNCSKRNFHSHCHPCAPVKSEEVDDSVKPCSLKAPSRFEWRSWNKNSSENITKLRTRLESPLSDLMCASSGDEGRLERELREGQKGRGEGQEASGSQRRPSLCKHKQRATPFHHPSIVRP